MHYKTFKLRQANVITVLSKLVDLMCELGKVKHAVLAESSTLRVSLVVVNDVNHFSVSDKRKGVDVMAAPWAGYVDVTSTQELTLLERGLDLLIGQWSDAWLKVRCLQKPDRRLYVSFLRTYPAFDLHMQRLANEYYPYVPTTYHPISAFKLIDGQLTFDDCCKDQTAVNGVLIPNEG